MPTQSGQRVPNWDQYAARWTALHGGIDPRRSRPSVERWLHLGYVIAKICARLRIKPGTITALGLFACLLVPVFAGRGPWWTLLAAILVGVSAITDTVDGALAIVTEHTTRLGYVYDSVVDRVAEICWLLALWRLGVPASLAVAAGAMSWLHEYTRARANAAGMAEIGSATLGERPTRVILAVIGLGLAGLFGLGNSDMPRGVATFIAAVWIVLAVIGFMQLFGSIHRALAGRSWPTLRSPAMAGNLAAPSPVVEDLRDLVDPADEERARFAAMPATTAIYTSQAVPGRHSVTDDPESV